MSQRISLVLVLSALLAGCGGNPFGSGDSGEPPVNPDLPEQLPGTANPSASRAITRYEAEDAGTGNGYAQNVSYDAVADTFQVDNLGFDADNTYTRSGTEPVGYPFGLYEAATVANDPVSGAPIPQFQHRLVGGRSTTGNTSFAIVRTGSYVGYGFGGFLMARTNGVTMPTTGQAVFNGDYAGLRDFNGRPGLQVTSGKAQVAIDFKDFNDGDAVQGTIYDRRIYDLTGADITPQILTALNAKYDPSNVAPDITELPVLTFKVGPGVIDANGEIRGFLDSVIVDNRGSTPDVVELEEGNYYAIVSGTTPDEVVGIVVVEGEDPECSSCTVRETGGFIAYR